MKNTKEAKQYLKKIHNLLSKGGTLIISDLDKNKVKVCFIPDNVKREKPVKHVDSVHVVMVEKVYPSHLNNWLKIIYGGQVLSFNGGDVWSYSRVAGCNHAIEVYTSLLGMDFLQMGIGIPDNVRVLVL